MNFLCPSFDTDNTNQIARRFKSEQKKIIKLGGSFTHKSNSISKIRGISPTSCTSNPSASNSPFSINQKKFQTMKKNLRPVPISSCKTKQSLKIQEPISQNRNTYMKIQIFDDSPSQIQNKSNIINSTPNDEIKKFDDIQLESATSFGRKIQPKIYNKVKSKLNSILNSNNNKLVLTNRKQNMRVIEQIYNECDHGDFGK